MSIPRDGLVAEYLFNGNAQDSSGHGHDGHTVGATLTANRFGEPSSAYALDGKNDYIIVVPPPRMSQETLSISVWARYDGSEFGDWNNAIISQDNGEEFWRSDPHHRRILQLSTKGRQITWHRMSWGHDDVKAKRPLERGAWHHVVAVVDGRTHRLFLDGELQDTKESWFLAHPAEPLYIGRKAPPEKRMFFNGCIDDVRIYNRALTVEEIGALYGENGWSRNSPGAPRPYRPEPEPLHWLGVEWHSVDVDTFDPGKSVPNGDQLLITAGGVDIWGKSDGFRYVYQRVKGDFAATTILTDAPDTHAWAKAGIMVRQSLAGESPNVAILGTRDQGLSKQWRAKQGGETADILGIPWQNHSGPAHLRVVRKGETVTVFWSADGATWAPIGEPTTIDLGADDVYVGLAVTSHAFGSLGDARFSGWQLSRA